MKRKEILIALAVFFAVFLSLAAFIKSRPLPDEGHYLDYAFYANQGEIPYVDFFDHHPPGITILFSPIINGIDFFSARILVMLLNSASALIVFFLAKRFFGRLSAFFSVFFFICFIGIFGGFWFINEPFMLFLLVSPIFLLVTFDSEKSVFAAGFLAFSSLLFKHTFFWFLLPLAAYVYFRNKKKQSPERTILFLAGGATVALLFAFWVFSLGNFSGLFQDLISYNLENSEGLMRFFSLKELFFFAALMLPFAGYLLFERKNLLSMQPEKKLFLAVSFFCLFNLFPFFGLNRLIPFLGISSVFSGAFFWRLFEKNRLFSIALVFCFAVLPVSFAFLYGFHDDFSGLESVAAKLLPYEKPIFVYPAVPEIYFLSKKPHVSKYLWVWPWNSGKKFIAEMLSDFEGKDFVFACFSPAEEADAVPFAGFLEKNCSLSETIPLKEKLYYTYGFVQIYDCMPKK